MANLRIYAYKACSTCKKAVKWLNERSVVFDTISITDTPPSAAELAQIKHLAQVETRKLFNTSGRSYREGGWKDKIADLSEEQALEALAADGKLIKRPILLGETFAVVGFNETAYRQFLGGSQDR